MKKRRQKTDHHRRNAILFLISSCSLDHLSQTEALTFRPIKHSLNRNLHLLHATPDTTTPSSSSLPSTPSKKQTITTTSPPPLNVPLNPIPLRTPPSPLPQHWNIGPTHNTPTTRSLPPQLLSSLLSSTHPFETPSTLGDALFVTEDWRKAWYTYESPSDDPDLIREEDGFAEYYCDEDVEGVLPADLVGTLYRNGPGKFGVNGERVVHVLDADALILQIRFGEEEESSGGGGAGKRILFRSKFVQTEHFLREQAAGEFLLRGTFGTAPRGPFSPPERKGLNEEPTSVSLLSSVVGNAFNVDLKNSANTQVISWGGKVLALFEAGLPHRIDPETLDTLGEDDMGGTLVRDKLPVKMDTVPSTLLPSLIGGTAHTAHPQYCPRTNHLIGWHWSQIADANSLEVTFTEWNTDFEAVATATHRIPNCVLAPHDTVVTENYILMLINAFEMNQLSFLSGAKGPAASLKMDGRGATRAFVFPRPTAAAAGGKSFEPYEVPLPAHFSLHFSHAYEDETTGNVVTFFSGWPPSDATDFLGAWGGFAPVYDVIPPTYLWRLEIDVGERECVDLAVAPGSANVCAEFPVVHPNFATRRAMNVYAEVSNVIGDSSVPQGYVRLRVEDGRQKLLMEGERNEDLDVYFFGTRYSVGEPLVVPKKGKEDGDEREAYLLGMVYDAVKDRSFVAIFDLERDLNEGPVCKVWLKSAIPHGLHGCFAVDDKGGESIFC